MIRASTNSARGWVSDAAPLMRFAEVFLRLGASLVGWMVVFTYLVWMAALHAMGCGPDGDQMHRVLLGVGPLALVMALALRSTRPFPDIHRMLGHLAWPAALLGLFGLKNVWTVFERTNLGGLAICADTAPSTFQMSWAPAQFFIVLALGVVLFMMRRTDRIETR